VPLDPHSKRLLDMLAAAGTPPAAALTPAEMREGFRRLTEMVGAKNVPIAAVENGELPGPDGPLPYRLYIPDPAAEGPQPACVYFHGGGVVLGDIDTHDALCRMLANESGCRVISVAYRLAPEHKFPTALYDGVAAVQWVAANAAKLAIDPARLAVAGDSAGAGIAAAACQIACQNGGPRIALQVLLCPALDLTAQTESWRALASGYFLDKATLDWFLEQACPPGTDLKDPRLSAIYGPISGDLPPAQIHTAEFDPLRDEGEMYAQLLRRVGVPVQYTCHEGMLHHFYGMASAIPAARPIVQQIGAAMRQALARPAPRAAVSNQPALS
jgi:acetyl esterase/lipase